VTKVAYPRSRLRDRLISGVDKAGWSTGRRAVRPGETGQKMVVAIPVAARQTLTAWTLLASVGVDEVQVSETEGEIQAGSNDRRPGFHLSLLSLWRSQRVPGPHGQRL
jgi:hypothetical protein